MPTIQLPAGTSCLPYASLAHRIADARFPLQGEHDARLNYGADRVNWDARLREAAAQGLLTLRDPLTLDAWPMRITAPADEPSPGGLDDLRVVLLDDLRNFLKSWLIGVDVGEAAAPQAGAPVTATAIVHSTKARRDTLTPVIELAKKHCRDPQDAAEVWAELQVLAEKKTPPLRGATEDGLQYLKKGAAAILTREALGSRMRRSRR